MSKLIDYNSPEKHLLLEVFKNILMIENCVLR